MSEPEQPLVHPSVARLYSFAAAEPFRDDTPAKVAKRLNVSIQTLHNWEDRRRGISKQGALAAQQAYGCDANDIRREDEVGLRWIATGKVKESAATYPVEKKASKKWRNPILGQLLSGVAPYENSEAYVRFPLLDGFAGMGRGDYVGDFPEIVKFVEVTREWAEQKLRAVPLQHVRVITGRGDSMRGQYSDGDLIFLDSRVKQFVGDSAYCFRLHGQVQIKRLQMVGLNVVRVLSANSAYPPLDVALEEVEIGGRAIAAWTLTEF